MGERMAFQVIWSDAAIRDLESISAFIAQSNPDAALRVGRRILEHTRLLSEFPMIGPAYPRGSCGPLREIVCRPYRIFYDVAESARRVEILHVWHGARSEPDFY